MAMSQSANYLEKALGHGDNAATEQDISNPGRDRERFGDPSGEKMKALCWMGKNDVQLCQYIVNTVLQWCRCADGGLM